MIEMTSLAIDHIDRVFYINLNRRTDRREQIEAEFDRMNLPRDKIERFPAFENGQFGCLYSHLEIVKIAIERGYQNIIIFEDDFQFIVDATSFEQQMTEFFDKVNQKRFDFYVLMLSYLCYEWKDYDEQLVIGTNCQDASGYVVNWQCFNELLWLYSVGLDQLSKTGAHWIFVNDQIWKKLQNRDRWFLFRERIGKQSGSVSDLANTIMVRDASGILQVKNVF